MKRKAKQNGSGGRLRLGLLVATAAAFLLVPAAQALANVAVTVNGAGTGQGEITSGNGLEKYKGTPPLECHWTGSTWNPGTPANGECKNEGSAEGEGIEGTYVKAAPANGSEFAGWTIVKGGNGHLGCAAGQTYCSPYVFEGAGGELEVTATFEPCAPGSGAPTCVSTIKVNLSGTGKVEGKALFGVGGNAIDCSNIPGEEATVCEAQMVAETAEQEANGTGQRYAGLEATPGPGWEWVEWTVQKGGYSEFICSEKTTGGPNPPVNQSCMFSVGHLGEDAEVTAVFNEIPTPQTLTLGHTGEGSFECNSGSGFEACEAEYPQESTVTVKAVADTGWEFAAWTGECDTESGAECEVEMTVGGRSVSAEFVLETRALTLNPPIGEGTLAAECDYGSGLEACASLTEIPYGTEVEVTATPESGNSVESLTGSGSASGCSTAGVGPEEAATCDFEIEADSEVSAVFATAASIAIQEENVHGEVPQTTELATTCENDVDLGEFIPGEAANYVETCGLTVTATGSENTLTAADESGNDTGYLTQKLTHPYSLPQALETKATGIPSLEYPGTGGGTFAPLTSPVGLLTYGGPVSADDVTLTFRQKIGLHDALHTGTYSKTITLTLKQTAL